MRQKLSSQKVFIILLLLSVTVTFLFILSCEDTPNGPDKPEPGRRDYTWTVDTLESPFWVARRIWGSSPDDIWLVGSGGSNDEQVWHFNGEKWELVRYEFFPIDCIHGFAEDNIWIGSSEGHLYQYNGVWWSEKYKYSKGVDNYVTFSDIWGESPDNIYAVGVAFLGEEQLKRAFILHYNGQKWEEIYFADENSYFSRIMKMNKHHYIWGYEPEFGNQREKFIIYKFNGNKVSKIYGEESGGYYNMKVINEKISITINKAIYNLIDDKLEEVYKVNLSDFGHVVYGRNKNDLFLRLTNGIAHYNGIDESILFSWDAGRISINEDAEIFDNKIVFYANDYLNSKTYVLTGEIEN